MLIKVMRVMLGFVIYYVCIGVGTMGALGSSAPLYFQKLTLCLHTRSLPTELEPPFIKPCSYAFGLPCCILF